MPNEHINIKVLRPINCPPPVTKIVKKQVHFNYGHNKGKIAIFCHAHSYTNRGRKKGKIVGPPIFIASFIT